MNRIEQLEAIIKNLTFKLDVSPWVMGPFYRRKIAEAEAELRQLRHHQHSSGRNAHPYGCPLSKILPLTVLSHLERQRKVKNVTTQTHRDLEQVLEILSQRIHELRYGEGIEQEELSPRKTLRYWKSKAPLTILLWMTKGVQLIS